MNPEEPAETEPSTLTEEEAKDLTYTVSKLLDDVEDVGLRLAMFVEGDEQTKALLPQIKMVVSMAFMVNSECIMACYDRHDYLVSKSRHSDVPVSPPTGYAQALEIADVMVAAIRDAEGPVGDLLTPSIDPTPNQAAIEKLQREETIKRLYVALEYALAVRGALLLIQSGFDFTAMNVALGFDKLAGGTTRFGQ